MISKTNFTIEFCIELLKECIGEPVYIEFKIYKNEKEIRSASFSSAESNLNGKLIHTADGLPGESHVYIKIWSQNKIKINAGTVKVH